MNLATGLVPTSPANRLGLNYRHEAAQLPWAGPILDAHTHVNSVEAARALFAVADVYGIRRIWSMTPLEQLDAVQAEFGDRMDFIAVPNFAARQKETAFTTDWFERIEGYAAKGARICKFWAAPRGRDFHPALRLDHPTRREGMKLARSLGMMIMVHVADPDTWFATHYSDARKYGLKAEHYEPLERLLDEFHDVPWMAAHLAGDPERLDHLQDLLDRHPNLHLDTSATKWMVRELSKHPHAYREFCRRNPGRILFGSDIVANAPTAAAVGGSTLLANFELFASRYWALRMFYETSYHGPSPIVDPDLALLDPALPAESTALMHGAAFDPATLDMVYHTAAEQLMEKLRRN